MKPAPAVRLVPVLPPAFSMAFSMAFSSVAAAQNAPVPRPVAPPDHVSPGEAIIPQARTFTAVRAGDRVLVAFIENQPGGRGVLHTALLRASPRDTPSEIPSETRSGGLDRARPDVELSPGSVRAMALAWDGTRGALVYIVPRALPGGFAHGPPTPQRHGTPLPPSVADPLGPSSASGGDVVLQRLDAEGSPAGRPVPVFTENGRLFRVAVALEGESAVVAWTGATVTDDEVRGTVRALRVGPGGPMHQAASATGFSGDVGDALRVVHIPETPERTVVVFTGARCITRWTAPYPTVLATDPSAQVENPARRPQPQEPPTEVPGPPIDCGPLALHAAELHPDDTFGPLASTEPLGSDALAVTPTRALASVGGALVAMHLAPARDFGRVSPWFAAQPSLPAVPSPPPPDTEPRVHPADGVEPALTEHPVPAPAPVPVATGVRTPAALDASPGTPPGAPVLVAVTGDHRAVAMVTPTADGRDATVSPLRVSGGPWLEAALLPDTHSPWVLARAGVWSGPVVLLDPAAPVTEAPGMPPPPEAPLDETFARLWVRVRTARAVFIRHENMAGALAARPEAPTDPRMPSVLATRARLRSRWESLCGQLQSRAQSLAHHGSHPGMSQGVSQGVSQGASADLLGGVQQLCEIHQDLQLGVPVNPAL